MPILVDPGTRSPGWLIVHYQGMLSFIKHSLRIRYLAGSMPADEAAALATATDLAEAIAPVMRPDAFKALYWRVVNEVNMTVFEGSFATDIVGTHSEPLVDVRYLSQTIEFGGRGRPTAPLTTNAGQARLTLWTGGTYTFGEGDKAILFSDPSATAIAAFGTWLETNGDVWADHYGQGAGVRDYVNVQFNAGAQRKYGT